MFNPNNRTDHDSNQYAKVFGLKTAAVGLRRAVRGPTEAIMGPKTFCYPPTPVATCLWAHDGSSRPTQSRARACVLCHSSLPNGRATQLRWIHILHTTRQTNSLYRRKRCSVPLLMHLIQTPVSISNVPQTVLLMTKNHRLSATAKLSAYDGQILTRVEKMEGLPSPGRTNLMGGKKARLLILAVFQVHNGLQSAWDGHFAFLSV